MMVFQTCLQLFTQSSSIKKSLYFQNLLSFAATTPENSVVHLMCLPKKAHPEPWVQLQSRGHPA